MTDKHPKGPRDPKGHLWRLRRNTAFSHVMEVDVRSFPSTTDIRPGEDQDRFVPLSEVAAPIRLFRPSGRTRWDGSRLITDRAAFWCATQHRMVNETEELDRWSPQSHRPSLADQNLSYNSQPSGLALLTKASMFQPLLPFDCWATVLSGRPRDRLAGRLSPACPIAPDPDACGR